MQKGLSSFPFSFLLLSVCLFVFVNLDTFLRTPFPRFCKWPTIDFCFVRLTACPLAFDHFSLSFSPSLKSPSLSPSLFLFSLPSAAPPKPLRSFLLLLEVPPWNNECVTCCSRLMAFASSRQRHTRSSSLMFPICPFFGCPALSLSLSPLHVS